MEAGIREEYLYTSTDLLVARPSAKAVWTSRRRAPDGHYVVVLGPYAKELLGVEGAEPIGKFYVYRTKSWQEVLEIVRRAKALGLDVRV